MMGRVTGEQEGKSIDDGAQVIGLPRPGFAVPKRHFGQREQFGGVAGVRNRNTMQCSNGRLWIALI
jgi:hypothetical protein